MDGGLGGEAVAGQLHAVAGIAGESNDYSVEGLDLSLVSGVMCRVGGRHSDLFSRRGIPLLTCHVGGGRPHRRCASGCFGTSY